MSLCGIGENVIEYAEIKEFFCQSSHIQNLDIQICKELKLHLTNITYGKLHSKTV
jgi:hypothetical protein